MTVNESLWIHFSHCRQSFRTCFSTSGTAFLDLHKFEISHFNEHILNFQIWRQYIFDKNIKGLQIWVYNTILVEIIDTFTDFEDHIECFANTKGRKWGLASNHLCIKEWRSSSINSITMEHLRLSNAQQNTDTMLGWHNPLRTWVPSHNQDVLDQKMSSWQLEFPITGPCGQ